MRIKTRDWGFIATIGVIVAILLLNGGGGKPCQVPSDANHRPLLDALARGKNREEVEKVCVSCHNVRAVPLAKDHPPKEQCLICHSGKS